MSAHSLHFRDTVYNNGCCWVLMGAEVMDEVAANVPVLEKIVAEIDGLAESGGKYAEAPHVIEVTLPMLCRY